LALKMGQESIGRTHPFRGRQASVDEKRSGKTGLSHEEKKKGGPGKSSGTSEMKSRHTKKVRR